MSIKDLINGSREHLPRVSMAFFIVVSYVAIIVLGGVFPDFINQFNKELINRLGDGFNLSVSYFLFRESVKLTRTQP